MATIDFQGAYRPSDDHCADGARICAATRSRATI